MRDRSQDLLQVRGGLESSASSSSGQTKLIARRWQLAAYEVGDLTAGVPPVPIPNTEVKPRWADCTARESVWESRSLPA